MDMEPDYVRAHRHSIKHREEILASDLCGCFYCLEVFPPSTIGTWVDMSNDAGQTALCPHCSVDSVIGSKSGYSLTDEFLRRMHTHWF